MRTKKRFSGPILGPVMAAVLLTGAGCAPGGDPASTDGNAASQFGSYTRDATYDDANRYSVYVPMPDGVRIAVDYFVPTANGVEASEPLPTILHYTRYTRAALFTDDNGEQQLSAEGERNPLLQHMLHRGYTVAVVDARGTGASFGVHNGAFSIEETADSYSIIEWIAAQPWSDGNVGMEGRSYPGMTQYQAATQAPPALKAIFPEMAGPTPYDFVYRGGTYKSDFINTWGLGTRQADLANIAAPVDDDPDGTLRDAAVAEHAANLWAQEMVGSEAAAHRDWAYETKDARADWDTTGTIDDLEAIDASGIAIYHLVGWYDIYTSQQPMLYASLEAAPQKMIIGPWVHSGGFGGGPAVPPRQRGGRRAASRRSDGAPYRPDGDGDHDRRRPPPAVDHRGRRRREPRAVPGSRRRRRADGNDPPRQRERFLAGRAGPTARRLTVSGPYPRRAATRAPIRRTAADPTTRASPDRPRFPGPRTPGGAC